MPHGPMVYLVLSGSTTHTTTFHGRRCATIYGHDHASWCAASHSHTHVPRRAVTHTRNHVRDSRMLLHGKHTATFHIGIHKYYHVLYTITFTITDRLHTNPTIPYGGESDHTVTKITLVTMPLHTQPWGPALAVTWKPRFTS